MVSIIFTVHIHVSSKPGNLRFLQCTQSSSKETHCKRGTLFQGGQKKSLYSAFKTLDIYTTSSLRDETLRSPPCPTCCTSREAPAVISQHFVLVYPEQSLSIFRNTASRASIHRPPSPYRLTLGRLTLGMITSLRALGASLRGLLVSPCGWYW